MTEKPLVSVLMAAYNSEKYIAFAIDSVLASSYTNFELIIVDDKSKDNTVNIARKYAAADERVKVFVNEQNLGDYPNRNKAASYAKGKYLKYVDNDDYIYPWGLEIVVQMMEQFPEASWGICSLDQYVKQPFPFLLTPAGAYAYNYTGPGLFHKAPLSSIIKRDVFEDEGGFAIGRYTGDFEMWHRLAMKHKVLLMPYGTVWYREHDEQESKNIVNVDDKYEEISIRYLKSDKCPLDKVAVNSILRRKKSGMIWGLIKGIAKFDAMRVKANWKCLRLFRRAK